MWIEIILIIILATLLLFNFFIFFKNKKIKTDTEKVGDNTQRNLYEFKVLNELSDKIGYSLGIENVIETITSSLPEFINYNTASYILFSPGKIVFRSYIEKPVSRDFIENIKSAMINSSSALLKTDFKNIVVEEKLWGTVLGEEFRDVAKSSFEVPLVVSEKIVGLLNIASEKSNFYKESDKNTISEIAKQATQALGKLQQIIEQEKTQLNAMVASMTDGVIMTDMQDQIIVANPAAIIALRLETKKNLTFTDFVAGLADKISLKDKIAESIRMEQVFVSDEISLPTGYFKIIISPVKDRWKSLGSIVVLRNITKDKELEKIKEEFTSMIVHELRSPLDSIKKMTALLRTSKVKKAEQEDCYKMMYTSSSDMLELIGNLLNIAKVEAGKFQIAKEKSDIKKLILSRISFFEISAKDAGIKLASTFDKNLPDTVEFDPRTISQVLNNLISNAIKFTKENGAVTLQALLHKENANLQAEAKEKGIHWFIQKDIENIPNSLIVAVTDTGVGIAKDQINNLFNKFSQVKNIFVEKEGTGLGLAITKSIIDSHGGTVGVDSIEGQGSTFYFTIPII